MTVISIDYFGTLDTQPSFWQELLGYATSEGMEVYVISGPWPKELTQRLEHKGYVRGTHYGKVFSILSYLAGKGLEVWYDEDRGSWRSNAIAWYRAKSEICQKIGSQLHIDSSDVFKRFFENVPTRFMHTGCKARRAEIERWHRDLKLANTFDDWDEYEHMLTGMYSM